MKKHDLVLDFILSIVTLLIYNLWMQVRQIHDINEALGVEKYSVIKWFGLTVITLGLYHCFHEYFKTKDLVLKTGGENATRKGVISWILAFFALWLFANIYQQKMLNQLAKQ